MLDDPNKSAEAEPALVVDPIFLEMETLNVHVIRGGGGQKYIRLDVTLEMRNLESWDEARLAEAARAQELQGMKELFEQAAGNRSLSRGKRANAALVKQVHDLVLSREAEADR